MVSEMSNFILKTGRRKFLSQLVIKRRPTIRSIYSMSLLVSPRNGLPKTQSGRTDTIVCIVTLCFSNRLEKGKLNLSTKNLWNLRSRLLFSTKSVSYPSFSPLPFRITDVLHF